MKNFVVVVMLVFMLVFGQGCASIVSSSEWPVTIQSNPTGQSVVVKDEEGVSIHNGTTPMTVTLSSHEGYFCGADYTIDCNGNSTPLNSRLNGWYAGNIIFGGLIGILIVDPLTGAMWRLPKTVVVNAGSRNNPMP